jgi:hypothetical protein
MLSKDCCSLNVFPEIDPKSVHEIYNMLTSYFLNDGSQVWGGYAHLYACNYQEGVSVSEQR